MSLDLDKIEPTTILGKNLLSLMKLKGLNFYRLGLLVKKHPGQIAKIVKGETPNPGPKMLKLLSEKLEVSIDYLVTGHTAEQKAVKPETKLDALKGLARSLNKLGSKELEFIGEVLPLPVHGFIRAGTMGINEQQEGEVLIIARAIVESLTSRVDDVYTLRVSGESLSGDGAHDGDRLLVLPTKDHEKDGGIYIIHDPTTGESVVRHLTRKNGDLLITSSNPDYPPLRLPQVEIIGRVIYIQPVGREV